MAISAIGSATFTTDARTIMGNTSQIRVAIVHDWLTDKGGAEKVLESLLSLYPHADLYSIVDFMSDRDRGFLQGRQVITSFIQALPFAKKRYRLYLPLMPLAVEQFDMSSYDLVISSSYAVAKGVLTGPRQCHVSYIHSPVRYAWDLQHEYLNETKLNKGILSWVARAILHYMRIWDVRTIHGVDLAIANSGFIRRRIQKCYGRDAKVIYPPVDVASMSPVSDKEDYFVTASRMVPYKKIPLIVEAFAMMPDRRLVVLGDGPEMEKVKSVAGQNVEIRGFVSTEELRACISRARAFIFAAEEDFGILPLEAQALGTPVIAYGRGGSLETVRGLGREADPTGVFFHEQSVSEIIAAVDQFAYKSGDITSAACTENARAFSRERFENEFSCVVEAALRKANII